jgi:hypothetical protein
MALEGPTLLQHHRRHAALMAPLCYRACSPGVFPRMQGKRHSRMWPETDDGVASVADGVELVASWVFLPLTDHGLPHGSSAYLARTWGVQVVRARP